MDNKFRFWDAKMYFQNDLWEWVEIGKTKDIEIISEKNNQNIVANSSLFQTRLSTKNINIRWKLYNLSLNAIWSLEWEEIQNEKNLNKITFSGYQKEIKRKKIKIENIDEKWKKFWIIIESWFNKIWLNSFFIEEEKIDEPIYTNFEILWLPNDNAEVFTIYEEK